MVRSSDSEQRDDRRRSSRAAALAFLGVLAFAAACGPYARDTTAVIACPSADGRLKATFWWETSGIIAVGHNDYWVSVSRANEPFERVSAIRGPAVTALHLQRGGDVRLQWLASNRLYVEYPGTARILEAPSNVEVEGRTVRIEGKPVADVDGLFEGSSVCVPPPSSVSP